MSSEVLNQTLKELEFDSVKNFLSSLARTQRAKSLVHRLKPFFALEKKLDTWKSTVEKEVRIVEEVRRLLEKADPIPDIPEHTDEVLLKLGKAVRFLQPDELLEIKTALKSTVEVASVVIRSGAELLRSECISEEELKQLKSIIKKLDSVVDDKGEILPSASEKLAELTTKLNHLKEKARSTVEKLASSPSWRHLVRESQPVMREGRYLLALMSSASSRKRLVVYGSSSSGETIFAEPPELNTVNNEIKETESEIEAEKIKVLEDTTSHLKDNLELILESVKFTGTYDFYRAKAVMSKKLDCCVPSFSTEPILKIHKAKHPLLVLSGTDVVPNDFELGTEIRTMLITGPNTGGKTVCLKTIGLLTVMALSGLHIPSDSAVIGAFSSIFTDIGDEQSISQNLSTFSSHLVRIRKAIFGANERSLVLIDELGAGTDPREGEALSRAIIEWFSRKGSLVVATTHLAGLKKLKGIIPNFENASVEFDSSSLKPTYRLVVGVAGESNAVIIARRIGLPRDIVNSAKKFLKSSETESDKLTRTLKRDIEKVRREREELERLISEYEKLKSEYERKLKALEEKSIEELGEDIVALREKVRELKRALSGSVNQISLKAVEEKLKEVEEDLKSVENERKAENLRKVDNPVSGMEVYIPASGIVGVVDGVRGGRVFVRLKSGLKVEVRKEDVYEVPDDLKNERSSPQSHHWKVEVGKPVQSIMIRGMRYEDAEREVRKAIDRAIVSGINRLEIIHGKGEGILRKMVHEVLNEKGIREHIKSYDLAPPNEGGWGKTIVEFK